MHETILRDYVASLNRPSSETVLDLKTFDNRGRPARIGLDLSQPYRNRR